jgi:probable RNA-binding protein EIF1AD
MAKPKRITRAETLSASTPPDTLPDAHILARVLGGRGNNLFAVQTAASETTKPAELLVELSPKFRRSVYLRRGGYVLVDQDALNTERDNKLGGVIAGVVMDEKQWRKMTYWPKEFVEEKWNDAESDDEEDESNVGKLPPMESDEELEST